MKGSGGLVSLEDVRREILCALSREEQQRIAQELLQESFRVAPDLKVSCPFGGCAGLCRSPSKRDPARLKAWVCGSSFSHDDRMGCCISYRRLSFGLREGVGGNRRFRR